MPDLPQGPVLCAVDLSEPSRRALRHAAAWAHVLGTRIAVVRVAAAATGEIGERAAAVDEIDEFVRATLPPALAGAGQIEFMLRAGEPASAILDAGAETGAPLVVVGTHGRGPLARAFVGSTATALLRDTTMPIAVVPVRGADGVSFEGGTPRLRVGTILVPLDLQVNTASQLDWAARLATDAEQRVLLLHVVPPGMARGTEADRVRAAAASALGAKPFRTIVREGRVVPEVIAAVQQEHAGLVIMGQSSDAPGAMAYDVLRRTDALVVMAP